MRCDEIKQDADRNYVIRGGKVYIRWLIRRDLVEVCDTEQARAHPLSASDLEEAMRQRNTIGMVAELEDEGHPVVGHMVYLLHANKLEIITLAVHPRCHRLGVGSAMVAKLVSKLSSHRRNRMVVTVRESNLAAQLFFKVNGFEATDVKRDHFDGEDGYRMVWRLEGDE